MKLCFGTFELDQSTSELRHLDGKKIHVERQVFLLLTLLAENGSKVTSLDEIVTKIWNGAPISDAAIASRIRSARSAVGDDGQSQSIIGTIRGQGYRLELPVTRKSDASITEIPFASEGAAPSIAVLPFQAFGEIEQASIYAPALAHELIVSLSLTKWVTVIARASSFQLGSTASAQCVHENLDVEYVLTGSVEINGRQIVVSPVLSTTKSGQVIWADRYAGQIEEIFNIKSHVTKSVVAAVEVHVPRHQATIARQQETESLDAWSFFHLGLNHIYRFTQEDNALSAKYFEEALARAPQFARAHAGLSFVAFQRAFISFDGDPNIAAGNALASAEKAMELAPEDPLSNFVLGRSYWVQKDLDTAAQFLQQAVTLNPNYAQGHYSLGLVQSLNGVSEKIDQRADLASSLSPLDPLLYGIHGSKAWSRLNSGQWDEAAYWGDRAARTPGAHYLIDMIAAVTHYANGDVPAGRKYASSARNRRSDASIDQFLRAFPLPKGNTKNVVRTALTALGFEN